MSENLSSCLTPPAHTVDNLEGGFKTFYLTNFNGVFDSVPLSWVHVKVDRSMIQPYMVWFGIYGQKTAEISLFQFGLDRF